MGEAVFCGSACTCVWTNHRYKEYENSLSLKKKEEKKEGGIE